MRLLIFHCRIAIGLGLFNVSHLHMCLSVNTFMVYVLFQSVFMDRIGSDFLYLSVLVLSR